MRVIVEFRSQVRALVQLATSNFAREERGQIVQHLNLHQLFLGNPGTGKTMVAEIYGRILKVIPYSILLQIDHPTDPPTTITGARLSERRFCGRD